MAFTLLPGVYEISDLILMLKSILPNGVKVHFPTDDNIQATNLIASKTIRFTGKIFFLHKMRFYSITLKSFEQSSTRIYSKNIRIL